jgi:hypothetical protein
MIRAEREGRKTKTRRLVKPQPAIATPSCFDVTKCPYGVVGDRLAVKEAAWMWCERRRNGVTPTGRPKWLYEPARPWPSHYQADSLTRPTYNVDSPDTGNQWGWRLKVARFLPAWAVRTHLEITNVRVEWLQEITEDDARDEGWHPADGQGPVEWFEDLWNSINGPGSWDLNPYVWVIGFRRVGK